MDERPVDMIQPDLACAHISEPETTATTGHKVHTVGQRRDAEHAAARQQASLENAVERPETKRAIAIGGPISIGTRPAVAADKARAARPGLSWLAGSK